VSFPSVHPFHEFSMPQPFLMIILTGGLCSYHCYNAKNGIILSTASAQSHEPVNTISAGKTGVPKMKWKQSVVADIGQVMLYCVSFMIGEVGYWIGDTLDDVGRFPR
jgi:hypothetical protein